MKCNICGANSKSYAKAQLMGKHQVSYYLCPSCEFVQTDNPHWLDEAYQSPINITDTGILERNILLTKLTTLLIDSLFNKKGQFLDYAGGYGLFVRMMRDVGLDFYWMDPYCKNIFANGFEYSEQDHAIECVTGFECFEHFVSPIQEIKKMIIQCSSLFFSTELRPEIETLPQDWWYFGLEHGQHISFYRYKTLQFIAAKFNLNLYSNQRNFHLLTPIEITDKKFKKLLRIKTLNKTFEKIRLNYQSKTISDMEDLKGRP